MRLRCILSPCHGLQTGLLDHIVLLDKTYAMSYNVVVLFGPALASHVGSYDFGYWRWCRLGLSTLSLSLLFFPFLPLLVYFPLLFPSLLSLWIHFFVDSSSCLSLGLPCILRVHPYCAYQTTFVCFSLSQTSSNSMYVSVSFLRFFHLFHAIHSVPRIDSCFVL